MNVTHFDVIIVGGGLVGMVLAQALHNHGLHIALIDAKPLPSTYSDDGRSIALNYSSQQILSTLNLWQEMAEFATPIESVHVSRQGVFAKTHLRAQELSLPALGYVIPAQRLAASIGKKIEVIPELTVYAPATVQNVSVKSTHAQLTLQQARKSHTLSARLVVAADGSQSTIAQQLGIHQDVHAYNQTAIVSTIQTCILNNYRAYERFTPQGVIALLPLREKEYGVVWTATNDLAEKLLALSDEEYLTELKKHMGQYWGAHIKLGKRSSYPLSATQAYEQIRPRVVILGNAAHTMHPVAAQGLNLALRCVAWLAETIVETTEDIGELSVLRRYVQRIQGDQQRVQNCTHSLVDITEHVSSKTLWNIGLGLFNKIPGVKQLFMRQAAGITGVQAKLARGVML